MGNDISRGASLDDIESRGTKTLGNRPARQGVAVGDQNATRKHEARVYGPGPAAPLPRAGPGALRTASAEPAFTEPPPRLTPGHPLQSERRDGVLLEVTHGLIEVTSSRSRSRALTAPCSIIARSSETNGAQYWVPMSTTGNIRIFPV